MNSNKSWVLQIDDAVYKFLSRIPRKDAGRILSVILDLPNDPFRGDIQKMQGEENIWRRRVGAYRLRYELIPKKKELSMFFLQNEEHRVLTNSPLRKRTRKKHLW